MRYWPAALVGLLLMCPAGARSACAASKTVNILGCVSHGVENGCLVIKDRETGKTYQIDAANPKPDPGQSLVVELKGEISEGAVDFCQQGPILTAIQWTYRKMRCAPAR